ncbi:MAG TPA: HIT domain-containing protein, partial [Acidothermaceae bacterium]
MSAGGADDIDVSGAVGVPDGLDRIWTPHRMAYIRGESKPVGDPDDPALCPFCLIPAAPDADSLVVARGVLVYAVLNLYPYNAGHLLVVPYRHVPDVSELEVDEAADFMAFTQRAVSTIRAVSSAEGFNIGMNLG